MGKNKNDANAETAPETSRSVSSVAHEDLRHQEMKPDHSVTGAGETSVSKATAERDTDYGADGADLSIDDIKPEVRDDDL